MALERPSWIFYPNDPFPSNLCIQYNNISRITTTYSFLSFYQMKNWSLLIFALERPSWILYPNDPFPSNLCIQNNDISRISSTYSFLSVYLMKKLILASLCSRKALLNIISKQSFPQQFVHSVQWHIQNNDDIFILHCLWYDTRFSTLCNHFLSLGTNQPLIFRFEYKIKKLTWGFWSVFNLSICDLGIFNSCFSLNFKQGTSEEKEGHAARVRIRRESLELDPLLGQGF